MFGDSSCVNYCPLGFTANDVDRTCDKPAILPDAPLVVWFEFYSFGPEVTDLASGIVGRMGYENDLGTVPAVY